MELLDQIGLVDKDKKMSNELASWTFKKVNKYGMTVIELENKAIGYRTHAIIFKDGGIGYEEANIKPITKEITEHIKELFKSVDN